MVEREGKKVREGKKEKGETRKEKDRAVERERKRGSVNFLKKNEITIPRLPPKATEPTYELIDCENNSLKVVLIP